MTEHSIEELERQYQVARSKAEDALNAANAARSRVDQAKLDATGLNGHLVSFTKTTWRSRDATEVRFVVRRLGLWGSTVEGPIVKKDGTLGERSTQARIGALTDHGPYVEPTP